MKTAFSFEVQTPEHLKPGKKYPVIFALHGIGYNEHDILSLVKELKNDFILIGIRGHLNFEKGHAYYFLKGYGNPDRELFDEAMKLLTSFIDDISLKYPIDQTRKYLVGFSQGAILSMSLGLVLGEKIRGIVAMNGYIPSFVKEEYPLKSIKHMVIFLSDGEHDSIFPPKIGQENYNYLIHLAKSVKYKTYPVGHEVSEENIRDLTKWLQEDATVSGNR